MAGRQSDFDPSAIPPRSAEVGRPASATLSYDSYLRVKSGISDSVLRMAGLPSAKDLSYEAYVAALGGKAQPVQRPGAARAQAPRAQAPHAQAIRAKAKQRIGEALTRGSGVVRALVQGKRNVLAMSGIAMALLLVVFIGAAVGRHIFGGDDSGAAEANIIPAQATGDPIALAVTQADELLMNPIMTDLEQIAPLPTFGPLTDQPAQSTKAAEVSLAAASKTLSKSAEGETKTAVTTVPKTATAKITKQPAKQVSVNTTKKNAVKAPKPAQVEVAQAEVVQAGTKSASPLGWLGQVFDDMSKSLGGSESSTDRKARPKAPSLGDRETKR